MDALNAGQKAAATARCDRPLLILAGAGTGKTTTLLARIAFLVEQQGIPPQQILYLAFNRTAVSDARARLAQMNVRIWAQQARTIDSWALSVVTQFAQVLGFAGRPRLTLVSSASAMAVMKAAVKRAVLSAMLEGAVALLGLAEGASWDDVVAACREQRPADYDRAVRRAGRQERQRRDAAEQARTKRQREEEEQEANGTAGTQDEDEYTEPRACEQLEEALRAEADQQELYVQVAQLLLNTETLEEFAMTALAQSAMAHVTDAKRRGRGPAPDGHDPHDVMFRSYQALQKELCAVDFGDVMLYALQLMREHPAALAAIHARHAHILVDEWQDVSAVQIELIEALHGGRGCLTIVGDDAQSIYTWRDARPGSFTEWMERHTLHTLRKLKINYRSRPYILQCGQAMIDDAAAAGVIPKVLQPTRPNDYRPVQHWLAQDDVHEGELIAAEIQRLHDMEQVPWREMVVLTRATKRNLYGLQPAPVMEPLQVACKRRGIPFMVSNTHASYRKNKMVKCVLAYLRLALDQHNDEALLLALNTPARGLGRTFLKLLHPNCSLWAAAEQLLQDGGLSSAYATGLASFMDVVGQLQRGVVDKTPEEAVLLVLKKAQLCSGLKWSDAAVDAAPRTQQQQQQAVVDGEEMEVDMDAEQQQQGQQEEAFVALDDAHLVRLNGMRVAHPFGSTMQEADAARKLLGTALLTLLQEAREYGSGWQHARFDNVEEEEQQLLAQQMHYQEVAAHTAAGCSSGPGGAAAAGAAGADLATPSAAPHALATEPPALQAGATPAAAAAGTSAAPALDSVRRRLEFDAATAPQAADTNTTNASNGTPSAHSASSAHATPSARGAYLGRKAPFRVPRLAALAAQSALDHATTDELLACMPQPLLEHACALRGRGAWPLSEFLTFMTDDGDDAPPCSGAVRLLTIHKAKGLEWDTVFLMRWNEHYMPCCWIREEDRGDPAAEAAFEMRKQEERRLAHVALTRAKDRLYITSVKIILGSFGGKRADVRECEYQLPQEPGLVQRQEFPKPRKGMAAGVSQQVEEAAAAAEQAVMMLERPVAAVVA